MLILVVINILLWVRSAFLHACLLSAGIESAAVR